jgi:peptidoglycan/xylan/chitin deacetylase (PgdA/CDA1 family)
MNRSFLWLVLMVLFLTSCAESAHIDVGMALSENKGTEVIATPLKLEPSATPFPSSTLALVHTHTATQSATITSTSIALIPTPTITPTPPPVEGFSTSVLRSYVTAVSYIENACTYLENRWGEGKSKPGTIVVPIMFHSIAKEGREIYDSTTISTAFFEEIMDEAKEMGFSTITSEQLVGFLEHNEAIPERSMILILDDRRPGVTELFMPYLEENNWTLTLGWPTTDETRDRLWAKMEGLAETGRLDVQSHGHNHIYIQDDTPMAEVYEEIYEPIEVIQAHFNTRPVTIVWPGGNFTQQSISIAREAGFKLGFTVFSRGPLMFNWIPQGDVEMAMADPLMVLPRFWSTAADVAFDQAVMISEQAKGHAQAVKAEELRFYERYCRPEEGKKIREIK